ncbi:hypothetical protein TNCT_339491 [Trichonephila clavata]|uniref:Uncharacterized protein n=1 Tax=Trichonephila clavata TaxID=2740835 RepID=A0A8X6G5C6_TRICU|nr:hypothetical protein TNCT_339491 [Trichonephila clavata]
MQSLWIAVVSKLVRVPGLNNGVVMSVVWCRAKDRVPVKNPNRLTEDEIRAMVQAICDEPEDENEVGRSDTSDDELIQESDHDTESEQELSVEIEEEIEKESEITEEYFFG